MYTTSVDIKKKRALKSQPLTQNHMPQQERSESARERRIALYKSDQQQQQKTNKNKPDHHYQPPALSIF